MGCVILQLFRTQLYHTTCSRYAGLLSVYPLTLVRED